VPSTYINILVLVLCIITDAFAGVVAGDYPILPLFQFAYFIYRKLWLYYFAVMVLLIELFETTPALFLVSHCVLT